MKASNIRVIDPATVPQKPYAPSMPVDSVLGSTAGFLFGAAFSIFRERLNRTIQEPGDASFYVGVSELGAIPSAARTRRFGPTCLPSPLRKVKIGGSPDGTDLASGKDGGDPACVELGSWKSPHSAIAAAYRSVVTSLILDRDPDARPRVIVVTSAVSGEGKTTTASNLAITLSRRGQRILLIDGDLLRPRLQNLFSVKNNTGLVNVLVQYPRVPLSGADVVRETSLSNLYLLPAGKSLSVFSSDLLWSDALRALIAACKARFDLVLIDTPPMLEIPDARVIARLADGVVFVVRARHSTRAATRAACLRLTEDGTNIFGIVLNDWNPRVSRNGYYGHRHSRYDGRPCSACPESAEARLKTALD